ncbi:MAG: tetratricopeptide repeat protein, partial [Candidatus Sulfotelmatobacter sp.]
MKRKFNVKFFLWLLGATTVVVTVFHGVHLLQARQTASGLLRMADQAEAKGNLQKARDYLGRYLKFVPENTEALARVGLILDKQAVKDPKLRERALLVLDQVLRREPGRGDLRRKAVHLAIGLKRFADAKTHLAVLMAEAPADGELFHLLGVCEASSGKYAEAEKALKKAINYPPKEIESYVFLATV